MSFIGNTARQIEYLRNIHIHEVELFKYGNIVNIEQWLPGARDTDHDGDVYLNRIYRVYIGEDRNDVDVLISILDSQIETVYAEREYIRRPVYNPNDPGFDNQCSLPAVKALSAWNFWDIPNVKANHPEKSLHPCQFPIELVERCIFAFTNEKDIVFDPYSGAGSAMIAALKNNRRAIGCEIYKKYIKAAYKRVEQLEKGKLPYRQFGKPIHVPSGKEKVSQIPKEWKQKKLI